MEEPPVRWPEVRGVRRVVFIGPVPPFRGGIAQHSAMLCRELARRCDLLVISFSRQYPLWLFPGESDRDPTQAPFAAADTRFLIDSLNPMTWRKAAAAIRDHGADLVILPWWTVFWAPCFAYLARRCRKAGIPVRLLCHNVVDHEAAAWKSLLSRAVLSQASSFLVHTRNDERRLKALFPGVPVIVHPHPVYSQFPPPAAGLPRRAGFELLFFGLVRPYKGLDILIEAMGRLADRDVHLTVVGEFWSGRAEAEARIRALGLEDRVELVPRYVTDQEAAAYFARADAVVLPYRSATGSGVVSLAYRYDKPVIVTRVGGLPDAVEEGETGLIVPPESPAALAEAISRMTSERAAAMAPAIGRLKATMTWEALAEASLRADGAGTPRGS
ncbi:MAG: glycosyltransferase [Alphaproteobacteria bacterium]